MRRPAIGVFNGNWKNGWRRELAGELEGTRNPQHEETMEICTAILPFFSPEKWQEWCDAGPDNNAEFLSYARAEWQVIHDEFCMDEPPLPEAETMAAESARIAEWLPDVANQPASEQVALSYGDADLEHKDWQDWNATNESNRPG